MAWNLVNYPQVMYTASTEPVFTPNGGRVYLKKIRWTGMSTAGHQCILQSGGANVFEAKADAGLLDQNLDFQPPLLASALVLSTLGSGTVYLYLD